ncbi:MAG: hypothetical protein NTV51_00655 [Verrucomicrobia bacterium]|nr:hypothetical protein [Verrucomicrobiota bacterium]
MKLPDSFAADPAFATNRPESFKYWRDARSATYRDRAEFDVAYGDTTMHVTIASTGDFRIWHASSPDLPPKRRDSFYLEKTAPDTSATFTTTFAPVK